VPAACSLIVSLKPGCQQRYLSNGIALNSAKMTGFRHAAGAVTLGCRDSPVRLQRAKVEGAAVAQAPSMSCRRLLLNGGRNDRRCSSYVIRLDRGGQRPQ